MYVISFSSTHHAMFAEQMLKKADIKIMVIPTPRQIDKSCGISIKFNGTLMDKVIEVMEKYNIDVKGIFEIMPDLNVVVHYPK